MKDYRIQISFWKQSLRIEGFGTKDERLQNSDNLSEIKVHGLNDLESILRDYRSKIKVKD